MNSNFHYFENLGHKLTADIEARKMKHDRTITVKVDDYNEYRVPSPDGSEDGAYYTDDRKDAFATCIEMYRRFGIEVDGIRIKRVSEHS